MSQRSESVGAPARQLSHIAGASSAATATRSTPGARLASARKTPIASAPFPTGTTTAAALRKVVEQLLADRLVAVELRSLGAVLEEERVVFCGVRSSTGFRLVHVGAEPIQLGALCLDQRDLRRTGLPRHEDDRPHAGALRCPRGRGAVIAGRRGHDDRRPQLLEHRLRAAPLEGAELMLVFALQPDAV